MPTSYVKQTWVDGVAGGTPVSAARLSHIEDGIENATVADGAFAGTETTPTVWKPTTPGDYRQFTDASIDSGTTALNSPTAAFTADDVGKTVMVRNAGAAGANLLTTIAAYVSPTQVTLAVAADTTVLASRTVNDGNVTNGVATLTSATANFTAGDKHKNIVVGTGNYAIKTVTNTTTIELNKVYEGATSGAASVVVAGAFLAMATPGNTAIQAAIDAAETAAVTTGAAQVVEFDRNAVYGLTTGITGKSNVILRPNGAVLIAMTDIVPLAYTAKVQFAIEGELRFRTAVQTTGPAFRLTGGCSNWTIDTLRFLRNESQAVYRFFGVLDHRGAITGDYRKIHLDSRTCSTTEIAARFYDGDGTGMAPNAVSIDEMNVADGAIGVQIEGQAVAENAGVKIKGGAVQGGSFTEAAVKLLNCHGAHIDLYMEGPAGIPNVILQASRGNIIQASFVDRQIKLIGSSDNTILGIRRLVLDVDATSIDNRIVSCSETGDGQFDATELGTRTTFIGCNWFGMGVRPVVVRTAGAEIPQYPGASDLETTKGVGFGRPVPTAGGEAAMGANTAYMGRFTVTHRTKVNRFVLYVGVASGNIDCGIYADDATGTAPGARIVSSGSVACPAAGRQAITITETLLVPGVYWGALVPDNGTATFTHLGTRDGRLIPVRSQASAFPLPATAATTGNLDSGVAFMVERR